MIACGYFHTNFLTNKGKVFQTGQTKDGNKDVYMSTSFEEIAVFPKDHIVSMKAKEFSVALNKKGELIIW